MASIFTSLGRTVLAGFVSFDNFTKVLGQTQGEVCSSLPERSVGINPNSTALLEKELDLFHKSSCCPDSWCNHA